MIRKTIAAATAALLLAPLPVLAQSQQEALDARYDRALAAGYKALFLCSAIGNAERNGGSRSPESVAKWELEGIQAPLDEIVDELPILIERGEDGAIDYVLVEWSTEATPRIAVRQSGGGCSILPVGAELPYEPDTIPAEEPEVGEETAPGLVMNSGVEAAVRNSFTDTYGSGTRTTAIVVMQDADVVADETIEDFQYAKPQRTWSVAKSIAATLVGAAVQRGEMDVYASAGLGAEPNDPRRAITIDHLLRMASGRYSDTPGNRTDPLYFGGSTVEETALHWPLIHAPGTVYRYANNDTLAAVKAIEGTFEAHPPAELFDQLGMGGTVAETDWRGDYILSSQVWTTAWELAKFGQLYLNDGVLPDGTRILPEGWVEYVSSPSGPQPEGRPFGYGAGFWLLNNSEGVPPDTFAALGNRGQHIVIVPSRDVVIVRRGEDPVGSRFDIAAFTKDVLAALGE